jgi:signal transduction histidine kinase
MSTELKAVPTRSEPAGGGSWVNERAEGLFQEHRQEVFKETDRVFAWLMGAQWIFGIVIALLFSPYGWEGKIRSMHLHVQLAVFLGAAISALPIALAFLRPGSALTRHVVAASQMLWSALLIHLSGGRIETHFHVFGSLAFLAFYRDWRILVTATLTVAGDHLARGIFWPESVYGIQNPEWWRFLEHAGWVIFENTILVMGCLRATREMRLMAARRAETEALTILEREKSVSLDMALSELHSSQAAMVRTERLAAVGQLAASVSHELRNPLTAIRNAVTYIDKRLKDPKIAGAITDPRVPQFLGVIDRELNASSKIISDLLDFARERPLALNPCPLRPLVAEAMEVVPGRPNVELVNEVLDTTPIPNLDKDQFRQVLINLVQNAVEAMPADRPGRVAVSCEGGGEMAWRIRITDDGVGIPKEVVPNIFQPLFTTKMKGTGLGLAIVATMVQRHTGTINVQTESGQGSVFLIELPPAKSSSQAA